MHHLYIVGHPVSHSKSPAMYNAAYAEMGLDWEYGFKDIATKEEAERFIGGDGYLSINITTPYKPEAYKTATIKAASAKLAQGVNLLVRKSGELLGYNVDGDGAVRYLERQGVDFKDAKVAVCGTGPTSMSILHACVIAGAKEVLLLGRDKERAKVRIGQYLDTYRHLASTAIPLMAPKDGHLGFAEAYEHADYRFGTYETSKSAIAAADIIIDATTLGMHEGDPAPFDTSLISSRQVVLDTVYGHGVTSIVRAAREAGAKAFDGAGMLVSQAVISLTILCEIEQIDDVLDYDALFDIMAKAADFRF